MAALLFSAVLLAQYPSTTTFPIGGDAARYIQKLVDVYVSASNGNYYESLRLLATNTRYPGAQIIFSAFSLLPLSWPDRFIWWLTAGHLFTSLALGLLLKRIAGWPSAVIAIAAWSLVTIGLTPHTEAGTAAQLWSLPLVPLFFYMIARQSYAGVIAIVAASFFVHPFTAVVLMLATVLSLPALLLLHQRIPVDQKRFYIFWIGVGLSMIAAGLLATIRYYLAVADLVDDYYSVSITDWLRSPLGPFIICAPFGFYILFQRTRHQLITFSTLAVFLFLSILLTFNDVFGVHLMVDRWQSYGMMSLVTLAALALPKLLSVVFNKIWIRAAFAVLLFLALGLQTWQNNSRIFAYYESPGRYARLHPEERQAIEWLKNNTPSSSVIVSTRANRHSDWIPILGDRQWQGLTESDQFWQTFPPPSSPYTHAVFFLHREKPADVFPAADTLPVVYQNDSAVIYDLQNNN